MELWRKIGVGIVMIVPSFVGAGLLYHWFHSWIAVWVWVILMVVVAGGIITGKIFGEKEYA